jgi:hypothetical protein
LTGPNNVDSSNIGDGAGPCLYGVHRAGSFNTSVQCAAECEKEPRCLGFIFGISQGVGCCYVKAYFPPATSTGFSGYSTYVKGTSGEKVWGGVSEEHGFCLCVGRVHCILQGPGCCYVKSYFWPFGSLKYRMYVKETSGHFDF